jgi:hypothetical protein
LVGRSVLKSRIRSAGVGLNSVYWLLSCANAGSASIDSINENILIIARKVTPSRFTLASSNRRLGSIPTDFL